MSLALDYNALRRLIVMLGVFAVPLPAAAADTAIKKESGSAASAGPEVKHILFLMFLNAPPRTKNPDWVLQSTSTSEFDSYDACDKAAGSITHAIRNTPTINIVGWCFPKTTTLRVPADEKLKVEERNPNLVDKHIEGVQPILPLEQEAKKSVPNPIYPKIIKPLNLNDR